MRCNGAERMQPARRRTRVEGGAAARSSYRINRTPDSRFYYIGLREVAERVCPFQSSSFSYSITLLSELCESDSLAL